MNNYFEDRLIDFYASYDGSYCWLYVQNVFLTFSSLSTYNMSNTDSYFIKVYYILKFLFIHQSQMNRQTDIRMKLTKNSKQAIRVSVTQYSPSQNDGLCDGQEMMYRIKIL